MLPLKIRELSVDSAVLTIERNHDAWINFELRMRWNIILYYH